MNFSYFELRSDVRYRKYTDCVWSPPSTMAWFFFQYLVYKSRQYIFSQLGIKGLQILNSHDHLNGCFRYCRSLFVGGSLFLCVLVHLSDSKRVVLLMHFVLYYCPFLDALLGKTLSHLKRFVSLCFCPFYFESLITHIFFSGLYCIFDKWITAIYVYKLMYGQIQ